MSKIITELASDEARTLLLDPNSYCNFDLPTYFNFGAVLDSVRLAMLGNPTYRNGNIRVGNLDNVNYKLSMNKDGAYAWRPFQLVHPVIYTELVDLITEKDNWQLIIERFKHFAANDRIVCVSLPQQPAEDKTEKETNIGRWWHEVEQESIKLSLEYSHLTTTDITDCYGSLYTHTVSWALHEKVTTKDNRKMLRDGGLLGNDIDSMLQDMHNRQTNGIPQGNMLSDLIAEIVLGFTDNLLSDELKKAGITEYKIIRFRDDYRIFTNTAEDGKNILLHLTNQLSELNLKLNSNKTYATDDIISGSVRRDKLDWFVANKNSNNLQHVLLNIRELAKCHHNSGSLIRSLSEFRKSIDDMSARPYQNNVLIAIVVDIMFNNPRVYPTASSVLSKLLTFENDDSKIATIKKIRDKFSVLPNVGYLDLWLQRVGVKIDRRVLYDEPLCGLIAGKETTLWNSDWLIESVRNSLSNSILVDEKELTKIDEVMSLEETESFLRDDSPDMVVGIS